MRGLPGEGASILGQTRRHGKDHMGLRYILLGAAIWAALIILRRQFGDRRRPTRQAPPVSIDMVRCARCGVHVPAHAALPLNDRQYCCRDYRQAETPHPGA